MLLGTASEAANIIDCFRVEEQEPKKDIDDETMAKILRDIKDKIAQSSDEYQQRLVAVSLAIKPLLATEPHHVNIIAQLSKMEWDSKSYLQGVFDNHENRLRTEYFSDFINPVMPEWQARQYQPAPARPSQTDEEASAGGRAANAEAVTRLGAFSHTAATPIASTDTAEEDEPQPVRERSNSR
ncbi:MAG: hypothetical protein CMF50_06330 [Legionellales bacterium]|nr:hypothetical protein [Legionellales bacterium]|tara:strand:+ start:147 stop:695 length:549 start_codon:yes stop_codon:yes gene_type:complete